MLFFIAMCVKHTHKMDMMLDSLFKRLDANTQLITANQRLSIVLNQQYFSYLQQKGISGSLTPPITSLQAWLNQLWQGYCDSQFICPPVVLSDYQDLTLWERIIEDSGHTLLRTSQTATLTSQAWQMLKRWDTSISAEFDAHEDTAIFKSWAQRYEQQCQAHEWLNQITLLNAIIESLPTQRITTKINLVLVGFLEFTPQQQRLLKALNTAGYSIEVYHLPPASEPKVLALADYEQELLMAALWVKKTLSTAQPGALIGCVIPNLAEQRIKIEHIFTQVLWPEQPLMPNPDVVTFNIGAAHRLSHYPIICAALNCLKLLLPLIPIETISSVIRSPFIANANSELTIRAVFDVTLRNLGERSLALKDINTLINQFHHQQSNNKIPFLLRCVDRLSAITIPSLQSPHAWVELFKEVLAIIGWPGEQTLSSEEHQAKERFEEALNELAQLHLITPAMGLAQAYERLNHLLNTISFQPQVNHSSIYLLSPDDALGFPFSHLWVIGMNDLYWPPPPKPNPFIPFQLQSRLAMPHATAQQALRHHQALFMHLAYAPSETVLSYARHDKEQALRPSLLLDDIGNTEITALALPSLETLSQTLLNSVALEHFTDDQGPAISANETVKGGISILKGQAACPFKAFAQYRLGANSLAQAQTGLSASERGNLIHAAMEYVWKKLENHANLCRSSEQELQAITQRAAQKAVLELKAKRPQLLKPRFVEIEIKRISTIIKQSLVQERQRPAFDVVATEQKFEYTFAQIPITIRIDRIDRLADGSHVIIDYKTGYCTENAWFGERPDDPQLPFYSITSELPISGLLYAQISSRENKYKGIIHTQAQAYGPFNVKPISNWEQQTELWEISLTYLANQFRSGYAKVDPKEAYKTCQFCDLTLLCRVNDR